MGGLAGLVLGVLVWEVPIEASRLSSRGGAGSSRPGEVSSRGGL